MTDITKHTNIYRLEDHHIDRCGHELAERGFYGTNKQIRDMLESDPSLIKCLVEWYTKPGTGLDTVEREGVIDTFAQYLLGDKWHWPYNMDSDKYKKKFFKKLNKKAKKKGWK